MWRVVLGLSAAAAALGACGDNNDHGSAVFDWDTQVVGSLRLDDRAPDDAEIHALIAGRMRDDQVALFYGHFNPDGTSAEMVASVLQQATDAGLPFLTFHDLVTGPEQRGICLSFDDDDYAYWVDLAPILAQFHARATFFVTNFPTATADDKALLHAMADAGVGDIQAHSITHPNALDYVAAHGIQAFIADEVEPSFQVLRDEGFAPDAYAHPYGATSTDIDDALLALPDVGMLRRITTR